MITMKDMGNDIIEVFILDDEYKSKRIRLLRHKLKRLHNTTRRALTRFAHDYCWSVEYDDRENHRIA